MGYEESRNRIFRACQQFLQFDQISARQLSSLALLTRLTNGNKGWGYKFSDDANKRGWKKGH